MVGRLGKSTDVGGHLIQFLDREVGYIAYGYSESGIAGGFFSEGGIYKTTDGGDSWVSLNLNSAEVTSMYFMSRDIGIFTDYYGMVYQTTDGGESWNLISQDLCGNYISDMIFTSSNTGYTVSRGVIFRTDNGGINWVVDYYSNLENSYGNDYGFISFAKTPNNTLYITGDFTMKRVE